VNDVQNVGEFDVCQLSCRDGTAQLDEVFAQLSLGENFHQVANYGWKLFKTNSLGPDVKVLHFFLPTQQLFSHRREQGTDYLLESLVIIPVLLCSAVPEKRSIYIVKLRTISNIRRLQSVISGLLYRPQLLVNLKRLHDKLEVELEAFHCFYQFIRRICHDCVFQLFSQFAMNMKEIVIKIH
jgi:hypothetical protein